MYALKGLTGTEGGYFLSTENREQTVWDIVLCIEGPLNIRFLLFGIGYMRRPKPPPRAPYGTVGNPIRVMMEEHETEGERFEEIRALSNGYTPPQDGCTTYRVTYSMLAEFEGDLHQHIHLENNILFPGAVELKETLF